MAKPVSTQTELHAVEPIPTPETAAAVTPPPDDPFDLTKLRLPQNFAETSGVRKLLRTVPVRKPNPQDFIRVHHDPAFRENLTMIELKEDRELFMISGTDLADELESETIKVTLYTAINRKGVLFLWPVRLPGADGKDLDWWKSARDAADEATKTWLRVVSNMSLGAYEMLVGEKITIKPQWPDLNFQELLRIAFRDRLITSLDHPVVKRLRPDG